MALSGVFSWLFEPIVLGAVSSLLVAIGTWMVLKDMIRDRRALGSLFSKEPAEIKPAANVVTSHQQPVDAVPSPGPSPERIGAMPPPPVVPSLPAQLFPRLVQAIADIRGELARDDEDGSIARDPSIETSWRAIARRVDRLIGDVEPTVQPVNIVFSPPGEPRWALSNHAFGNYRRINLSGESVGWLRTEITTEGQLRFRVRAHQPDLALLNAEAVCDLGRLNSTELVQALTVALLPITRYATWIETKPLVSPLDRTGLDATLQKATEIANGALAEARASFRRSRRQENTATSTQRYVLDVLMDGQQIALMRIEEADAHVTISVGVPDPSRLDLARGQQLASEPLAAYELAEAMATCAWPALAHALGAAESPRPTSSAFRL